MHMTELRVPLNDLCRHAAPLRDVLIRAMTRVIDRGHFVLGPEVAAFEAEFAATCGVPHCVGVANGTDAIELALRGVGVEEGNSVLVAANAGMYASVATLACGARPIFVDIIPGEASLDPAAVAEALDAGTRPAAVVVTHLYGRVSKIDELSELASRHGIPLVEDCAQAHGARTTDGRPVGSIGDAASFSFYPTKNLGALGDGGAVVCRVPDVDQRVRRLRQYGWEKKYVALVLHGRNSRLDELQAAILLEMLPLLPKWNERRRDIASMYDERITNPAIEKPPAVRSGDVAHLYVVRSNKRDELAAHLAAMGISFDVHYPVPDHLQPCMIPYTHGPSLPETERDALRVLSLPIFPEMEAVEVERVIQACNVF